MQNASSNVLCLPSYRYLLMIVPRVLQFSFIFIWQMLSCDRHNPFQANVPFLYHSWQRGPNSLILWRPTHYIAYPLFSNIVLKYIHRQPPPPLLFLFSCFIDWMGDHLLTGIMDLYMSSVVTLVPEAPWCVFYATTRHQVYWGLPNNVIFCWYSDLISHTHTNTHSTLRGQ